MIPSRVWKEVATRAHVLLTACTPLEQKELTCPEGWFCKWVLAASQPFTLRTCFTFGRGWEDSLLLKILWLTAITAPRAALKAVPTALPNTSSAQQQPWASTAPPQCSTVPGGSQAKLSSSSGELVPCEEPELPPELPPSLRVMRRQRTDQAGPGLQTWGKADQFILPRYLAFWNALESHVLALLWTPVFLISKVGRIIAFPSKAARIHELIPVRSLGQSLAHSNDP